MLRKAKKRTKKQPTGKNDVRVYIAAGFFFLFAGAVVLRLLYIQLWERGKYGRMANKQYVVEIPQEARRGKIYDRNNEYLILNETCYSIGLDKRQMEGTASNYAKSLARLLKMDASGLRRRIQKVKSNFVWLRRRVDVEVGDKVAALELPGILVEKDARRIYPHHEIAGHILGFTDADNKGIEGAELQFNDLLSGEAGKLVIQRDGRGRAVPENIIENLHPTDGASVVLTIDYIVQTIVTEELRAALRRFGARNGSVIVMNPQNGEILAMANEPSYNPNAPAKYSAAARRNRAVTDIYEPGSTFKVVTYSALFENKLRKPADKIFAENGLYVKNGRKIRDTKPRGWLQVGQALSYSSNIGTAKLSEVLGKERFFQAASSFGFGGRSLVDLPGEAGGMLKSPSQWSDYSQASMSIGQEVSVTALQMALAYAAIANGGLLLKPRILLGTQGEDGKLTLAEDSPPPKRILSKSTADLLKKLLQRVVEEGTGEPAKLPNLNVAGKTGTAQKALPNGRGYSATEFVSNFAGFYPVQKPEYLIYVKLETSRQFQWGKFSAEVFKNIAERIRLREKKFYTQKNAPKTPKKSRTKIVVAEGSLKMPDVTKRSVFAGLTVLEGLGLDVHTQGSGSFIASQFPAPGKATQPGDSVSIELFEVAENDGSLIMPKVVGLSMREALNKLTIHGLEPVVYGSGNVVKQKPAAGSRVRAGIRCVVECTLPENTLWRRAAKSLE